MPTPMNLHCLLPHVGYSPVVEGSQREVLLKSLAINLSPGPFLPSYVHTLYLELGYLALSGKQAPSKKPLLPELHLLCLHRSHFEPQSVSFMRDLIERFTKAADVLQHPEFALLNL